MICFIVFEMHVAIGLRVQSITSIIHEFRLAAQYIQYFIIL
jgi:hypothetical protein